jgi:stringent starvation protein B
MSEDSALMTSHRPYLLRALYEWIADNGMTPHLLVDATRPAVQVPMHAVKDGKIVLNIAERAVSHLEMGNDVIRFSARFGGVSHPVSVPVGAVLAIYARETGQGMALPDEALSSGEEGSVDTGQDHHAPRDGDDDGPGTPSPPRRGAHLRIVK